MPALRAHLVFVNAFRDAAGAWGLPGILKTLEAHWPEAVAGGLAPDAWPLFGGTRYQMHGLHKDDPATWDGAIPRWLASVPSLRPGRSLDPAEAAFLLGYLSHLGLDTWSLYLDPALPEAMRAAAPAAWLSPPLQNGSNSVLRSVAEQPITPARWVDPETLGCVQVPDAFPGEQVAAMRRLAAGMAAAQREHDPWRASRVNPIRPQLDTPEAREQWEARRAAHPPAPPEAVNAAIGAALDFTRRAIERWW